MANPQPIWCSDLNMGIHCARSLFHSVADRDKRPPKTPELQAKLDYYTSLEKEIIVPKLQSLGWKILVAQAPVGMFDPAGNKMLTGKVDAFAIPPEYDRACMCEIKTSNDFHAASTENLLSLINHDEWYYPGQVAQLFAYMLCQPKDYEAKPYMSLVQFCRDSGTPKVHYAALTDEIPDKYKPMYKQEYSVFAQKVMLQINTAWQALLAGNPPGHCNDYSLCKQCQWFAPGICKPPVVRQGVGTEFMGISAERIARYLALKGAKTECERLQKAIEDDVKAWIKENNFQAPDELLVGGGKYLMRVKIGFKQAEKVPRAGGHTISLTYTEVVA